MNIGTRALGAVLVTILVVCCVFALATMFVVETLAEDAPTVCIAAAGPATVTADGKTVEPPQAGTKCFVPRLEE